MSAAPDRERLRAAIKSRDAWWAHYVIGPLANRIVAAVGAWPAVTPNRVTVVSLLVGLGAAPALAEGSGPMLALGALVLQVSFLLDCVDGQLARYRGTSSLFGSMLDRVCDRLKLFAVTFGIAWGVFRQGGPATAFALAFVYFFGEYMLEVYIRTYRRLAEDVVPRPGTATALVVHGRDLLRLLDLPIVRLAFADRYFLVSLLALAGQARLLLWVLAVLGAAQALLRPLYYALHFRAELGYWPWNDERSHALGQNL